ncbi:PhzF family phenazine biosynthesis protein [Nitratireductor basaltis]|uniref:PhzF family phenazine biosynthesis protein n=1 Tax=Nitratireductor basaltis TaxID=472175 RepID=A0A084U9W7_9HYPH|nr:PhzF family phenazine biosynthesis protein [Nitratireductor basaltis]KFB09753.1 PhzF family phenazine biosynthesis protein [Nitratireductor basaltis]
MKNRSYAIYDVFTDKPLSGNPLAIVYDSEGLSDDDMQRIAGEFNLSETVFVLPAENPIHSARVRIFTPWHELPFAGHPTVGTAISLAMRSDALNAAGQSAIIVLEEKVGPVRCAVNLSDGGCFAEFDLPRLPRKFDAAPSAEAVAAALALPHNEIGFENHKISVWSAGVPYVLVPVANLGAAARVNMNAQLWRELAPSQDGILAEAYVYCRETVGHENAFHARMLAPLSGITEDPATGSAAAAFAGAVHAFDAPVDGSHQFRIEQGLEMGRPSLIRLEMDVAGGAIDAARIGGSAVEIASGTLRF